MNIIANLLDEHSTYAFVWTLVHSLWQCALVAVVLAITLRINRNLSANLRYLISIVALVACLIISVATYRYMLDSIREAEVLLLTTGSGVFLHYPGGFFENFYQLLNRNVDMLMLIWLMGFCLQAYGYVRDFVYAQRLKNIDCELVNSEWMARAKQLANKLGLNKKVQIKNSTRVSSICVIGHFRPVVLLPIGLLTSMSTEQVEALLLHEFAHVCRNDYLVNAVQSFVRLLYFFNPAVIWISKMIDIERENACDDIAVKHCGSAKVYANSLANISELEINLRHVLAARNSRYNLLPRVTRLFSRPSSLSKTIEQLISALCACGVVLAMNVSAAELDLAAPALAAQNNAAREALKQVPTSPEELATKPEQAPAKDLILASAQQVQQKKQKVVKATAARDYVANKASLDLKAPTQVIQVAEAKSEKPVEAAMPKPKNRALEAVKTDDFSELYLANALTMPKSRKIYVAEVPVEFAKVWMERFGSKTGRSYRESIKQAYGSMMHEALNKALTHAGWEVVGAPASDAIELKTRIHHLYITAPQEANLKDVIVARIGQSGIEFIFTDTQQKPFMKIVDYRNTKDVKISGLKATRATNQRYFRMLMESWGIESTNYLERLFQIAQK